MLFSSSLRSFISRRNSYGYSLASGNVQLQFRAWCLLLPLRFTALRPGRQPLCRMLFFSSFDYERPLWELLAFIQFGLLRESSNYADTGSHRLSQPGC